MRIGYRTAGCLAVAIAASGLSCGSRATGPTPGASLNVYTGTVEGTDVQVGIVATDAQARIFFCGGPSSYSTRTKWLTTAVDVSGLIAFERPSTETWSVDGNVDDGEVAGLVDMGDAVRRPFRAAAVRETTIAGLYEGMAACGRVGLIVTQPSAAEVPTGQGACVGPPTAEQVNPLRPIVRAADGTIRVTVGAAAEETVVRAAAPP